MQIKIKKILIVGAGIAGKDVLRELLRAKKKYDVIGFIDDDISKKNKFIKGVKILGEKDLIPKIVKSKNINEVIIAIPSADGSEISKVVNLCAKSKVKFSIVPRVKEIIEGRARLSAIRKVEIEDLLGRPVVKEDVSSLKDFFNGKCVLLTGAAGSIGSELSRQIAAYKPKKLVLVDWWENGIFDISQELSKTFPKVNIVYVIANIQHKEKLDKIFKLHKPQYVFHAAAYKHVPLMEDNSDQAVENNIFGTMNVAEISLDNNVKRFVQVSTDKAAKPVNVMGMTKLIAESIVSDLNSRGKTKFMIVRFGNVLGSNGSVIPIFRKQIESGGPVTITDPKMTRFFMTIPEAAQLIIKAGSIGNGGELFVLDMGNPVRILELAEQMIRLSGFVPGDEIKIVFTGKRKGEKISEILFNEKEKLTSTKDGKIFKTESFGLTNEDTKVSIKRFKKLLTENDYLGIREEFDRLINKFKE